MSVDNSADPAAIAATIQEECAAVLVGNEETLQRLTIALLTRGHILLEGVPGVAKTTVANLFARVSGLSFTRIQMTPDMLPADITGTTMYHDETDEFTLHRGPIFSNIVVADEINRATPKTQSALLEAMQERQVTIEGETLSLPEPFMVIATQNPLEFEGVYELPEAQRDRFQLKLTIDLPDRDDEQALLERFDTKPTLGPADISQRIEPGALLDARAVVDRVHIADAVTEYLLDVIGATRDHPDVEHGASPRAGLALQNGGKALAAIEGRDYVIPDDIKSLAPATLEHRLVLTADAELSGVQPSSVIEEILADVAVPGVDPATLADPGAASD